MPKFLKIFLSVLLGLAGLAGLLAAIVYVLFLIANKTNGEILSGGEKRAYLLYVPKSYRPGTPTPLVISIHGFAEWPAHQAQISRWNALADEHGFLVVYPSGTGFPLRWRATGITGNPNEPLVDLTFISDLIDKLEKEYSIDPARIYANGLSNGGGMSFLLSCKLSERIAAIGGVAGAYLLRWDECNPSRPVPLIAFHGTADPIVPFGGSPSRSLDRPFLSIPEWVKAYALRTGCTGAPQSLPSYGSVTGIRYSGCKENAEVIFYTIPGGGHTWPGGDPLPEFITGTTSYEIDATRLMWEFFKQHPLVSQPDKTQ